MSKQASGYIAETRQKCNGNKNGYIYALVDMNINKGSTYVISYSDDKDFYLNEKSVSYIGVTNNPIGRIQDHRQLKTKKMGMVIFDEAKNPAEGKMLEAKAIYNFCELRGKGPKWQKGHDTWSGA